MSVMNDSAVVAVRSSVSGGSAYSVAQLDEFSSMCALLKSQAAEVRAHGLSFSSLVWSVEQLRAQSVWCPAAQAQSHASASANVTMVVTRAHENVPYARVSEDCTTIGTLCTNLSRDLDALADMLSRASGIYAQAESTSRNVMTGLLAVFTAVHPLAGLAVLGLSAAAGVAIGSAQEGSFNGAYALKSTAWEQEGVLTGISAVLTKCGITGDDVLVARGAQMISSWSAPVKNLMQGDTLVVEQVEPSVGVVGDVDGIAGALSDLDALAGARYNDALSSEYSYATIAISKYVDDDGQIAWLVTVPGTDGQADSPFGWEQNLELMSASREQRMQADSSRMVVQAMRDAGISSSDRVAIIGHSQGGIVAAEIASDYADEFDIEHVVTAGSPIANHPIDERTYVTSIEMDDELVAAMDGSANPVRDNWVTIRGSLISVATGASAATGLAGASAVVGQPQSYEITHYLKYHEAAYENAVDIGSEAVMQQNEHFQQTLHGTYEGTTYWRGRMTNAGSASSATNTTNTASSASSNTGSLPNTNAHTNTSSDTSANAGSNANTRADNDAPSSANASANMSEHSPTNSNTATGSSAQASGISASSVDGDQSGS